MPTQHGPREMLFQHDFFWEKEWNHFPGGWPFLFPICGRITRNGTKSVYLYDGKQYTLDIHGFGWKSAWEVLDTAQDSLTLCLKANEQTLQVYPFSFEVQLHYQVTHKNVSCYQTYTNHGNTKMPYYAGFHPYLSMPAPGKDKDAVQLDYQPTRRFQYNETLTDIIGEQPLFKLPSSISNPDILEQLTFLDQNKEVQLTFPDGLGIHIDATGSEDKDLFSYLQLYTIKDKPFFCAEHWMAFPNALNTVSGVRWLEPGQTESGCYKLWITE
jgi:galactose mutarotase-like enzyme